MSNEVAALVEELKSKFRTVTEVVVPFRKDMAEVKERLSALETKVDTLVSA